MVTRMLDGNEIAKKKMADLTSRVEKLPSKPTLALIQIGNDESSNVYVRAKMKRAHSVGIEAKLYKYETMTQPELLERLKEFSDDSSVNAIMIENPLPPGFDYYEIAKAIPYYKDVDALSPVNQGSLNINREFMVPATPRAVVDILDYYGYDYKSVSSVAIINHSPVVGRPLSMMLLNRNYTVTICHVFTADVRRYTRNAKVVVVAVGKPDFLDRSYVNTDSIVIDVGINYVNGSVKGDVKYDDLNGFIEALTPVPGGVGPVTATNILENVVRTSEFQMKNNATKTA
ncbi:MAG: tetrahydrofolate dehydrogenase/cyclohydrolase catalytic domain-containing protein [Thermoplasmata archaeon]